MEQKENFQGSKSFANTHKILFLSMDFTIVNSTVRFVEKFFIRFHALIKERMKYALKA
jgi:hypothetical protein